MKNYLYTLLIVLLAFGSCDDSSEVFNRYSKIIDQSKDYPVYLDMTDIAIVKAVGTAVIESPFKIASNNSHYFVGEMLKGIHVYEKKNGSMLYVCFIECKYIKDFDLVGNYIFSNNFVDLVVIDVSSPLTPSVVHRQQNHFNRFSEFKNYWNFPNDPQKGIIAKYEQHTLSGVVTEKNPALDFSEYDQLYGNLKTKEIPATWLSNVPINDKPYVGIAKIDNDDVYTYGTYNSWAICTFKNETFLVKEENIWSDQRGDYRPPYYYSNAFPRRMYYEENMVYILGALDYSNAGYVDCMNKNNKTFPSRHISIPASRPIDVVYAPLLKGYFVLTENSVWSAFEMDGNNVNLTPPQDTKTVTNASGIISKNNYIITLGKALTVYVWQNNNLQLFKTYPDIEAKAYLKTENALAVANSKGLFLYDITDLNNIKIKQ